MAEEFFEDDYEEDDEDEEDCACGNCTKIEIQASDEVEVTEFEMSGGEINEWINELMRLKEEKGSVELFIDENNILKINYEELEDDEDEEDDDEEFEEDEY